MTPGPSNIVETDGGRENNNALPSLEELLFFYGRSTRVAASGIKS